MLSNLTQCFRKIFENLAMVVNYKYEVMLAHSFDRFYIIAKFMLPSMGNLKFSHLNFDHSYTYMHKKYTPNMDSSKC